MDVEIIPPSAQRDPPALKAKSDEQCVLDELGEHDGRIALAICDRLATEPEGLETIAGQVRGMDGNSAARQFYRWRIRSASLSRMYARACSSRAHVIAHTMLDAIEREPDPHKARVKMDAVKWLAARFNRADFGDEPGAGVSVTINNDGGSSALQRIQERLARKRAQLRETERSSSGAVAHQGVGKSMLAGPGGGVERRGEGEGEGATPPRDPESRM